MVVFAPSGLAGLFATAIWRRVRPPRRSRRRRLEADAREEDEVEGLGVDDGAPGPASRGVGRGAPSVSASGYS